MEVQWDDQQYYSVVSDAFPLNAARNLVNFSGTLYFSGQTSSTGSELWKSNGTESGTILVRDIWPGSDGVQPHRTASDGQPDILLCQRQYSPAGTVEDRWVGTWDSASVGY